MSKGKLVGYIKALDVADVILEMYPRKEKKWIQVAGSLRRCLKQVHDVDIVAVQNPVFMSRLNRCFGYTPIKGVTPKYMRFNIMGVLVDILFTTKNQFGAALMHATGSVEHNIRCRMKANRNGWYLTQYALHYADGCIVASRTEKSIYKALGMPFVNPIDR